LKNIIDWTIFIRQNVNTIPQFFATNFIDILKIEFEKLKKSWYTKKLNNCMKNGEK